jgi:glycosyltransferase involved in cell wall biosynthesis
VAVGALSAYLATVSVAALAAPGRGRRSRTPAPVGDGQRRYAILVPAHNEEAVIELALKSLSALDYPPENVQVHVVCDNCTDSTADIVRRCGFSAHERDDRANAGKGPALNWLHDRLVAAGVAFDVVVILDADTSVAPSFLRYIDEAFENGAVAAQGFYGVREPEGSTSAGLRYAALACRHHLRALGRTRVGGSCGLYGNGMAFDASLMRTHRWSGHLTEDMELQNELLLAGHRVVYVPGAAIEAEMPETLDAAAGQNERWELGRIQMATRYVPRLARRLLQPASRTRVADADGVFDHLVPPLSVLVLANGGVGAAALGMRIVRRGRLDRVSVAISAASTGLVVAHVLAGLWTADAPRSVYRSLAQAPRMILWKVGLWKRVLVKPDDVTWTRTARNSESTGTERP